MLSVKAELFGQRVRCIEAGDVGSREINRGNEPFFSKNFDMRISIIFLCVSALMFAGCSSDVNKAKLQDSQWDAVYIRINDSIAFVDSDPLPFLVFTSDTTIAGNTGCNSFAGSYTLGDDDRIIISVEAMTMMLCMDIETEPVYIEQLQMAEKYGFASDTLVLMDPAGTAQIKFTKSK